MSFSTCSSVLVAAILLASCASSSAEPGEITLEAIGLGPGGSPIQPGVRVVRALEPSEQDLTYEVVSVPDEIEASFLDVECGKNELGFCSNLEYRVDLEAPDGQIAIQIKVTDEIGREIFLDYEVEVDSTP